MLLELEHSQFRIALPLLEVFDYSLSIQATVEGNNPGRIFVDQLDHPRLAFALTVEGYFLAGESGDPEINRSLRHFLKERIFSGEVFVNGDESLSLAVHPESWEDRLPELIPGYEAEKLPRYHYLCRKVEYDWCNHVPEGYYVRQLDNALLYNPTIHFTGPLSNWMEIEQMWGSIDNFLANGISYCILTGDQVVAWCTSDCMAGDRIDVGVITHPKHRRRDLAKVVVAATVEHCLRHGFKAVGWHCNVENRPSWKTAERVGFHKNREYNYYYYMYDLIDHLAELGWCHYRHADYARAAKYYEQVFSGRADNPDYYYHLAASAYAIMGNHEKALEYLAAAIDHGWEDLEFTMEQEEFRFLINSPEWSAILHNSR